MQIFFIALLSFININFSDSKNSERPLFFSIKSATGSLFIEKLKNNEHFYIIFARADCFPKKAERKIVKISKKNNSYFVSYQGQKKEMTNFQIEKIKTFEVSLKQYSKIAKCTSGEKYMLLYNKESKIVIDNSCSWHGFEKLVADFFG
jgi:hypothetical protein